MYVLIAVDIGEDEIFKVYRPTIFRVLKGSIIR